MKRYLPLLLRFIAAVIFLQTLYFKFSGAEESVWITRQLGVEPWGRIGSGIAELVISILLLLPSTAWIGALGGLVVISMAILAHLFVLGISVQGDGGLLFGLAVVVFFCCAATLWFERGKMRAFFARLGKK